MTLLLLIGDTFLIAFLSTGMCAFYAQNLISCLKMNSHQNRGSQLPDTNMVLSTTCLSRVFKDIEHC